MFNYIRNTDTDSKCSIEANINSMYFIDKNVAAVCTQQMRFYLQYYSSTFFSIANVRNPHAIETLGNLFGRRANTFAMIVDRRIVSKLFLQWTKTSFRSKILFDSISFIQAPNFSKIIMVESNAACKIKKIAKKHV